MDLNNEELEATRNINTNCKCCKDIEFLKYIYDKRYKFVASIKTKSKCGTSIHGSYKLNYCPLCGKKLVN